MQGITLTGKVVEVRSTTVDEEDRQNSSLHSKEEPPVTTRKHRVKNFEKSSVGSHAQLDVSAEKDDDSVRKTQVVFDKRNRKTVKRKKKDVKETVTDTKAEDHTRYTRNSSEPSPTFAKERTDINCINKEENSVMILQEGEQHNPHLITEELSMSMRSSKTVVAKSSATAATIHFDTSAEGSPFLAKRKRRGRPRKGVVVLSDEVGDDGVTKSNGETAMVTSKASTVKLGKRSRKVSNSGTTSKQRCELVVDATTGNKRTRKTSENLKTDAPSPTVKQVVDQPKINESLTSPEVTLTQRKPKKKRRKRIIPKQCRRWTARSTTKGDSSNDSVERTRKESKDKVVVTKDDISIKSATHTVPKDKTSSTYLFGTQTPLSSAGEERATKLTREAKLVLEKVSQAHGPGNTQVSSLHQDTHQVESLDSNKQDTTEEVKRKSRRKAQTECDLPKSDEPMETAKAVRRTKPKAKRKTLNRKKKISQERIIEEDKQMQQPTISVTADKAPNLVLHNEVSNPLESMIGSNYSTLGINPSHEPLRSISPEIPLQNTLIQDISSRLSTASSHEANEDDNKQICALSQQKNIKSLDGVVSKLTNGVHKTQTPPLPPPSLSEPLPSESLPSESLQHATNKNRTINERTITSIVTSDSNTMTAEDTSVQGGAGKRKQVDRTVSFANPETKRRRTFLSKRSKNVSMFHLSVVDDKVSFVCVCGVCVSWREAYTCTCTLHLFA